MSKLKNVFYSAGAIESATMAEMNGWRDKVDAFFASYPSVAVYNPVKREAQKTGRESGEHIKYVIGLKKAGLYERFTYEMDNIWTGLIKPSNFLVDTIKFIYLRSKIDGNELRDLDFWADIEAVVRSDGLITFMPKDVQTVGTIIEMFLAMLFQIPIYLIIDVPKTEANSTMLWMVIRSGGGVFYKLNDCLEYVKEKHNIK